MHALAISIPCEKNPESRITLPHPRIMLALTIIIVSGLCISLASLMRNIFLAEWTPELMIVAISSLISAITASIVAVINARTKARIEEHKAISQKTQERVGDLVVATNEQKFRVEELHRAVDQIKPGEQGEKGERGERGEKGERGNGH